MLIKHLCDREKELEKINTRGWLLLKMKMMIKIKEKSILIVL